MKRYHFFHESFLSMRHSNYASLIRSEISTSNYFPSKMSIHILYDCSLHMVDELVGLLEQRCSAPPTASGCCGS